MIFFIANSQFAAFVFIQIFNSHLVELWDHLR